ncbi:MAG: hypothetical protein COY58_00590 [Gammaproteobacteria bacterium CG_4_10_14_0_8_um_filter_38_16]|nr:MAG: hypothetical protein COY58_00590 [Gammaproteobacteria bacterium CG_4_10_14_0_8_um_filter_38_16]PJA04256.1 MAG: hypothetical protein COX72_01390 [Gammaproteobacteria bacterium CG_4_10_14_0_2_um_filter_38_22]PJB10916.1 MAG: hypothetical protein CO120_02235 [Gammaproteobacteria bacterium CG_4_9_14_3_um_filter_38_9]
MKVIAFVSHRYIDNYDFDLSVEPSDRLIAFVLEPFVNQFPENKKRYFHEIVAIPMPTKNTGPLIRFDYSILRNSVENVIAKYDCKNNFWLMCVDEVNMSLSARIRDELNLPGIKECEALLFQNKILMKNHLENSSIQVPTYESFNSNEAKSDLNIYYQKLKNKLGEKFVLKPSSYTGSFGVSIVKSFDDFNSFFNSKVFDLHEYEAETFIDGDLYHCDIAMRNKEILFSECCKYTCPNNDFSKGKVIASLILPDELPLKSHLSNVATEAVICLGAINGVFHVELFVTSDEIYFLEVAARPAGGLVAKMYEKMFDINLFTLDFGIHLNADLPRIKRNHSFCLQALLPINKHVIDHFNETEFKSHVNTEWLISNAEITKRNSKSVVDVAGKSIFYSNNYEDIKSDFYKLKALGVDSV